MRSGTLLSDFPADTPDEVTQTLVTANCLRIERIVSHGHCSAADFWYDQNENEWVILLSGGARLRFEAEAQSIELEPGDYVHIDAHVRHRVEWTDPHQATIWLAVFYL